MKIGVDAVLLGAWADVSGCSNILDVGTGCGVIALMAAQRNDVAHIMAIDIDKDSVDEASMNFSRSPWSERLKAEIEDFTCIDCHNVDLIISNPPYFNSGIDSPQTARLVARHDASLSPLSLLRISRSMLGKNGRLAMVIPADREEEVIEEAGACGLSLRRGCRVRGHESAPVKRILLEFVRDEDKSDDNTQWTSLILEISPNRPTDEHRRLCKDFYLKF